MHRFSMQISYTLALLLCYRRKPLIRFRIVTY